MQSLQTGPYNHTCVSAGVDWMTATAATGDARSAFRAVGDALLSNERADAVDVRASALRDYRGWRAPGLFVGERHNDTIIVLSGAKAPPHWAAVAQVATNVSRLDLQASVWTHGEQPRLSRWYYQRAVRQSPSRGRPRSYSLIQSHPQGDTLYVGSRQSDYFGRVYDWASAHKEGMPRTIWRFEIELKRQVASAHTRTLLSTNDVRGLSESLVRRWYDSKGIQPTWPERQSPQSEEVSLCSKERDTLAWFERSLRQTIRREIKRHGITAVLDALDLSGIVIPLTRKED